MDSDSSRSSDEYHDVIESTADSSSGYLTPPAPEKRKLFGSLTLRRRKSAAPTIPPASPPEDHWQPTRSLSLPHKKNSIKKFLSFRRKSKGKDNLTAEKSSSTETLCEEFRSVSPLIVPAQGAPLASRETLTEQTPVTRQSEVKVKYKTLSVSKTDKKPEKKVKGSKKPEKNLSGETSKHIKTTKDSPKTDGLEVIEVFEDVPSRILSRHATFQIGTEDIAASQDTLSEFIEVSSAAPRKLSGENKSKSVSSETLTEVVTDSAEASKTETEENQADAFPSLSRDIEDLEGDASNPVLHNTLRKGGSPGSFKSAESPELRNAPEETGPSVLDAARQGSLHSSSDTVQRTRPIWKNIFRTPSQVDGIMSQPGPSKKPRGRANRDAEKTDKSPDVPPKSPVPPRSPTPPVPDEKTIKKATAVAVQEMEKKVSGDDLRKQLTEGLKNGKGKTDDKKTPKDLKAQLSEITQDAASVSAAETRNFIQQEKKNKEAKPTGTARSSEEVKSVEPAAGDLREMPTTESKKEHLYKILVIGELGAGKTSIIKRYVHQFFSQHYRATIGVDFALKVINWDETSIIRLQLWDIAGQERFGNMTRVYYKEAVGAFIVFDVTRAATFEAVQKWKQDLDSKVQLSDGSSIPCILLANKCDQPKEGVANNKARMDEYCKENGFASWFETSAKDNIGIEEAARGLVKEILSNEELRQGDRTQDPDKIALDGGPGDPGGRSCNC